MAEKLFIQIALDGGAEIERQLADIGAAGQKAFAEISKSAEQVGGFKQLDPKDVTAKLQEMGVTGVESIEKIQKAVQAAGRLEGIVQGVAAVEAGFMAVVKAAAVVGTAVVAAGAALSNYTSEAAKTAEALAPLADLSGKAAESISALQVAFAKGGTSVQQFAKEFAALEVSVQQAARTMATDVEASSQRIVKAQFGVAQSMLAVQEAQLAQAEAAAKASGHPEIDALSRDRERASLAIAAAQQRVIAAQQAQQDAAHQARVAEANDLQKVIQLYQQMGVGVKVAFDPLTTEATKNKALFATLAQAGKDYTFVLADILKNASALERVQIGKALGLDPKTVETLSQGSTALRQQQQAVEALGIALTDVDRSNLKAFSDSWSALGATASAALEKLGAALAPLGSLVAQGLLGALKGIIQGVQTTIQEFNALVSAINAVATVGAGVIAALAAPINLVISAVFQLGSAIGGITWDAISGAGVAAWNAVVTAIQGAITAVTDFASKLLTIVWDTISGAGVAAWNALTGAIGGAATAVADFFSKLASGAWDKVKALVGLGGGSGAPAPGMARGGLLGGRGTGTSDSNLAWVSRGEHIMPARAVAQPGVLAFLEALRRSGGNLERMLAGMGRFALGGMVPRPMMIPAFAGGGLAGGGNNVTIQFPGLPPISGLRASSAVVDELHRAAALAQVRSGGRKPSRYT